MSTDDYKKIFAWIIAALALVMLAAPFPTVATMIAVLLIAGLVFNRWQDLKGYLP